MPIARFLCILVIGLASLPVLCQQFSFSRFSIEQGLPQSEIMDITDDQSGYLWMATSGGGLCRFNGISFDTYTKKDGISDNIVLACQSDSEGHIWMVTPKGVMVYDGLVFKQVYATGNNPWRDKAAILEYPLGSIWIMAQDNTNQRQVIRIRNDSVQSIRALSPPFTSQCRFFSMISLKHKGIAFGTNEGIFQFKNDSFQKLSHSNHPPSWQILVPILCDRNNQLYCVAISRDRSSKLVRLTNSDTFEEVTYPGKMDPRFILASFEDRNGSIWFSFQNEGVLCFDQHKWHWYNKSNGLDNSTISCFFQDHEGNIWLGSRGSGLFRFNGKAFLSFNEKDGLPDPIIQCIFQSSNGDIFLSDNKNGLSRYNGQKIEPLSHLVEPAMGSIRSMAELDQGKLIIASLGGMWFFNGKKFSNADQMLGIDDHPVCMDVKKENDTLWIATYGQGLIKSYNGKVTRYTVQNSSLVSDFITNLFIDSDHHIWIASQKGASRFNRKTFDNFEERKQLRSAWVTQIAEDKAGNIWLATFTGGLTRFSGQKTDWFDTSSGLSSDNVYSITADHQGNLWCGMQNGIDKLEIKNQGTVDTITHMGRADGYPATESNASGILCDREGHLWFGTIQGAIRFDPGQNQINYLEPPVFIRQVVVNHLFNQWENPIENVKFEQVSKWFHLPEYLSLPHYMNQVSFQMDALCYSAPEKVTFQWKLEPLEEQWTPASSSRSVNYSALPPGTYTFRVKAANNHGIWTTRDTSFQFTIRPAWHQTQWFRILIFVTLLGFLGWLVYGWTHRNKTIQKDLEYMVSFKTVEMQKLNQNLEDRNKQIMALQSQLHTHSATIAKKEKDLQRLYLIGRHLADNLSVSGSFDFICQTLTQVMDFDMFGMGLVNSEEKSLEYHYVVFKNERLPFIRFTLDDMRCPSVRCINENNEIIIMSSEEMKKYDIDRSISVTGGIPTSSALYIPLRRNGSVYGVITVQSLMSDAFTDYQISFIRQIALYATGINV